MRVKCKNPYFDENIDRKFVFLLYSVLIAKGINLGDKLDGLFISDDKVGILETHLDYEMAVLKEVSVYEAFESCIPEGMFYHKSTNSLIKIGKFLPRVRFILPDIIPAGWDKLSKIKHLDNHSDKYFFTHISGSGYVSICAYPDKDCYYGIDSENLKEVSIFEAIPELIPDGMRYNKELDKLVPDVISAADEYCSGIKVEFEKVNEGKEQILKRENGFIKADKEKINFSLIDPYAYEDLGKCLTIGAKKYSANNWKLGDIESYIAALDRHLIDIKKAVLNKDKSLFIDKDTTLQHGANLLCNAMFIHYFIRKQLEEK